jgi:CheY-like chemotaxis protein
VHLIDDLMDIARISGGKVDLRKQHAELQTMLATAVETSFPLIESGKHQLVVDISDEVLVLDADPTRIAQIFGNLLNNAAKYTPAGGKITLTAYRLEQEAVVSISDNGVGIEQDSLSVIFDMFNQVGRDIERSQGGLGIGLSLVRRLVEMHGGSVAATSDGINLGATFTVRLPLAQDVLKPVSKTLTVTTNSVNPLRIMVVDDNVDAAQTLCTILAMNGHTVEVAFNGLQALEVAKAFIPQAAFLDIGMPGMNGYETARALRELPSHEKIMLVALTGWGAENDRGRTREAGFNHHLTKPAELAAIDALLSRLCQSVDSITENNA